MSGAQVLTSVSILDKLNGYMDLSLTEYNTSAAAAIATGSVVKVAGAFFEFAGPETINASSWTAISTGSTAYIALTASGISGSQIVEASYTETAPTWRADFGGWYASAASEVRIVGSVYKAEATSYYPKRVFTSLQTADPYSVQSLSVASSLTVGGAASAASLTVGGAASVASSLTVDTWPVPAFHPTASVRTTVFPIGTIIPMARGSGAGGIGLGGAASPLYLSAGTPIQFVDSTAGSGGALSGSWVSRGICGTFGSDYMYLVQRIS